MSEYRAKFAAVENDGRKRLTLMELQRARHGISQKRLAELTGLSPFTIQQLEACKQLQIGLQSATRIGEVLHIRADELLTDIRSARIEIEPRLEEVVV